MTTFSSSDFFPCSVFDRITESRIANPGLSWRAAQTRIRRQTIAPSGRLNLLAADHPARCVTRVGSDELGMADRRDYLARILRILSVPRVDGIMTTMDIIEDLLVIDALLHERQAPGFLDDRVIVASLNRGGLAGCAWELDDPVTGATPAACASWQLDGVKLLMRVDESDSASLQTIMYCAQAIREANALNLPTFLEPLPVTRGPRGYSVTRTAEALAKLTGVASALGNSSRLLWLKLPACDNFATVARATTLPILLLGGESSGGPAGFLNELKKAMQAGGNVRGALAGRNVLYPWNQDPAVIAGAAGRIVHDGFTVDQALKNAENEDSRCLDRLMPLKR